MKIYWSQTRKYNRRKSPRAAIEKKWSQHDLRTKVQLPGCECLTTILRRSKKATASSPTTKPKPAKVFNVSYESY